MPAHKVVFRTDASVQIGIGHLMRCLTLADQLRCDGAEVVFVCRDLDGGTFDLLDTRGYRNVKLEMAAIGTTSQQDDARETIKAVSQMFSNGVDWLVVDQYELDAEWERRLRPLTRKLMVIDDLANRTHDCDLLLDQNYYRNLDSRYQGLVPEHCVTLLGPEYVLLRPEFAQARQSLRARDGIVRRVLVFFGGSDPANQTQNALEALRLLGRPDIEVDVVVGLANPNRNTIQALCESLPNVRFHCQVSNMAELILNADVGVGAGGATSWERCCLGLPCVVAAIAENQVQAAKDLSIFGAAKFIGAGQEITVEKLKQGIQEAFDEIWATNASSLGLGLVDGQGVVRVTKIMEKSMAEDAVLGHWNERAKLADRAGSDDLVAKELEKRAISRYIKNGMVVAEFGCGNGTTALELLRKYDIELHCFDFSPAMIESAQELAKEAGMGHRIQFEVGDVRKEPDIGKKFDVIYSERMVINLPDWESQARAILYMISLLKVGGRYLMCENSRLGLDNLNKLRLSAGLEEISPPWHNVYLIDDLVSSLVIPEAELVGVESFSATYYFLSRVVNAWLAAREGVQPSYDAPVNQLALELPPFGDCAQGKLWIFEKS